MTSYACSRFLHTQRIVFIAEMTCSANERAGFCSDARYTHCSFVRDLLGDGARTSV